MSGIWSLQDVRLRKSSITPALTAGDGHSHMGKNEGSRYDEVSRSLFELQRQVQVHGIAALKVHPWIGDDHPFSHLLGLCEGPHRCL